MISIGSFSSAASTRQSNPTFDDAFAAVKDRLDPRDPASVAHSVGVYQDLADRFAGDPHVWKATLAIANVLSLDPRPDSHRKAIVLFSRLKALADPSNSDGRLISDRIIAFDLFYSDKWHPELLTCAKDLADRYETWAVRQDSRPALLHIYAIKGAILSDLESSRKSIEFLLGALKTAESWGNTGYYSRIAVTDNSQYQAVILGRQELLTSLANAIRSSQESDVELQVAHAQLIGDYPTLRAALDNWRNCRNPVASEERTGDPSLTVAVPTTAAAR